MVPVGTRRVSHGGSLSLEAQTDGIVQFPNVLVIRERMQVGVVGLHARFPVRLREDPQEHIVRMGPVRIGHRGHVQPVRVQVCHVGRVLAVDMSLQTPAGTDLRMDHLKNLLGKKERYAIARISRVSAPDLRFGDLRFGQRADLAAAVGRHVNGIGTGTHRRLLLVEAEQVADFDLEDPVASNTDRGTRAGPVVAEQRRRGVARRG